MIRARLRHRDEDADDERRSAVPDEIAEIDAAQLTGVLNTPGWLRQVGFSAWMELGVMLVVVGAVWLLSLTQTIVMPIIAAGVIAAVASPLVAAMNRHRVPRGAAAGILLVGMIVLGAGI